MKQKEDRRKERHTHKKHTKGTLLTHKQANTNA